MSYRPLTTRRENSDASNPARRKVAYLEPNGEFVPTGAEVKRMKVLTQAQYNALTPPDENTLYFIVNP